MRNGLLLIAGILVLASCNRDPYQVENPDPNHTHADLAIWIGGARIDLSDDRFMSGLSTDDASHDEVGEYHHEHLHLHDNIGHVIHRHKPGLTLGDFFASIGMPNEMRDGRFCMTVPEYEVLCAKGSQQWRFFVNGEEMVEVEPNRYVFEDMDKIVLIYDFDDGTYPFYEDLLTRVDAVTDDACLFSKRCPWRGDPLAENCVADPAVPCVAPLD